MLPELFLFLFISIGIGCASAQRLVVVHENGRDLRTRGAAIRSEVRDAVFTDAGDQTVADGPRHRRARPRRDAVRRKTHEDTSEDPAL